MNHLGQASCKHRAHRPTHKVPKQWQRGGQPRRLIASLAPLAVAIYVGLTRIIDYWWASQLSLVLPQNALISSAVVGSIVAGPLGICGLRRPHPHDGLLAENEGMKNRVSSLLHIEVALLC